MLPVRTGGGVSVLVVVVSQARESLITIVYNPPDRLINVGEDWNDVPPLTEYERGAVPPIALIWMAPSDVVAHPGLATVINGIVIFGFSATVTLPFMLAWQVDCTPLL
jgi:hypothetical protein